MRIGMSITKRVLFRGFQQEFSNVYHYNMPAAVTGPWEAMIDENVASEKWLHSADVTFVRAAVWSAGGSAAQNEMLFQKLLTGVGGQTVHGSQDRERAVLVRWPAGVDSRGKPVYLRKWFHSCGSAADIAFTVGNLQNTEKISTAHQAAIVNYASRFNQVGSTEQWDLCSAGGRMWQGQPQCHAYLEHHQLGDMWR